MIYKKFHDLELSSLGMGCMRLPTVGGDSGVIDEAAAAEMFDLAIQNGINYFDTAWGYHGGNSEIVVGKLLKKYPRDKFYLATKFPGFDVSTFGKTEEIFEKQLSKCQVDYFDFYLFHNVCERNIDPFLDDARYGTMTYLRRQKEAGRIRHLGFSTHGSLDTMGRFLDAYSADLEFCQIQLNWLDWSFQNARAKIELLKEYDIPVWVMEPLRGGRLAGLSSEYTAGLAELRPAESVPGWSFRFLQTIPEVTMILSGMSDYSQVKANIDTFQENKPLSDTEWNALLSIADQMLRHRTLACTSCRYCTTYCPKELDIPSLIKLYNAHRFTTDGVISAPELSGLAEDKKPSACLGCRACEEVCPQQIKISEMMADLSARMG